MSAFKQLGLSTETLQAISKLGFEEPTPIQKRQSLQPFLVPM